MKTQTKRRLFNIAWSVADKFNSFGEALKHAWKVIKLSQKMQRETVKFRYMKKDGSMRPAIGTLNDVPATKGTRPVNNSLLTYFDLEAQDWRSAKVENLIF